MPRVARCLSVLPDHPHHIILRGNNRRRLFSYPRERRYFLRELRASSDKHRVPIHVLTLMTNHVHLVATPTHQLALSRFVGSFSQKYAQFRNRSRSSSGKLFEQRYNSIPITDDEQAAVTTVYVELNPVLAGISSDAISYPWSTHRQHLGLEPHEPLLADLWTPSAWYLSLGSNAVDRAAAFEDWFDHYRSRDDWSAVCREKAWPSDRKRFERPDRRGAT